MTTIDWYFDFISPFAYLQHEQLGALPANVTLNLRPVLFGVLLDHWGGRGPGEVPPKRRFVFRQVQWQAARLGIPLRFPPRHPSNPLPALRLAIALGCRREAIATIFRFIWAEGRDTDDPQAWGELCARLGAADAEALIGAPQVKAALRANCDSAVAAGVFGVPTAIVDGELFWGADSTQMLIDYLERPESLDTPEMRRVSGLPYGARRKA